jgi:hypothetical protein
MANETKQPGQIVTIERHILEEQSSFPAATGTLTALLYDIALAGKIIASKTNRAGLAEILGRTGATNIQGEQVQKLDQFADTTFFNMSDHTGRVAVMASEEHEGILPIPKKYPAGKYVLLFDPLDGSSNIDFNICLGTIFCVYHKISEGRGSLADCLQKGRQVVAAGYLLYGTSTMLVYSTGRGVNGFTLDPAVGEFLLSLSRNSPNITASTRATKNTGARACRPIPPGCRGRCLILPACQAGMSVRWWRISTAICWPGACSPIRPTAATPPKRMANCVYYMKQSRWPSWQSKPGVLARTGHTTSWTSRRKPCTSARPSLLATGGWCRRLRNLSGNMTNSCSRRTR